MSSSNSPCAACKCLRRKCTQECVFSPYFPPDNPQKFTNVHNVFGASNVSKLLNDLSVAHREDAVNSLAFEAESRLKDPVYGCVGIISALQHRLRKVHQDLDLAKKELSTYIGPSAMLPMINHPGPGFVQQHPNYGPSAYQMAPHNAQQAVGLPTQLIIPDRQQQQLREQQFLEAQQIAAAAATAAREQEMMRTYEQQQQLLQQQRHQQTQVMSFNSGFEEVGGSVTATGFNQMSMQQPTLALGTSYEAIPYHQIQQQQNEEHAHLNPHQLDLDLQDLLQFQQQSATTSHETELVQLSQTQASHTQQQLQLATSEEDKSIGTPC